MAMASVLTPVAALSYPIAIVLPKEDSEAKCIAWLSVYIALGVASLSYLVLLVAGDRIVELLQAQKISSFILLIPLVIVFSAWLQIKQQWLIRKKQFKITARVAVLQAFIVNGTKSGIGLFKPVAAVLIVIYTLGTAIHAYMLSIGTKKADGQNTEENIFLPKKLIWGMAKKYYDFALYRTPAGFFHGVAQSLPILMLAAFFGPASAGFFALCKKLLNLPATLISKSVGDVFYPRITEAANRNENLTKPILKGTLSLAAIGFGPFALVIGFAPWLFGFVFGKEWVVAGEYARWYALLMFFNFINKPCVVTIPVLKLQLFQLIYEIFSTLLKAVALFAGFYFFKSDLVAVALFSITGVLLYIVLIMYVILESRNISER